MNKDNQLISERYKTILLKENNKIQYLGNCADSFDDETGECNLPIFSDVSDFANKEEEFRDAIEDGRDLFLNKDEFVTIIQRDYPFLKDSMEFYFFPEEGFSRQIYVAYDPEEDIHYFFA